MIRGKIHITQHAKDRLRLRIPELPKHDYTSYVSCARYNGTTMNMTDNERLVRFILSNFKADNHTQIRIYDGYAFVFRGHKSRTLVTVVPVDGRY